ncbi:MAG: SIMPL domain-containing protein [Chthonomonadetes bacterium]|nr:SIMPL domain-containing protein [Chthonomonadetes bacterium]
MKGKILLTLCLIGLAHSVLAQSAKQATSPPRSTTPVRVSAVGEAQAMPDRAVVYFVLSAQGRDRVSARLAVQQLGQRMQDELAKLGVTKSQLKAERLDIAEADRPVFTDTDDTERTERFMASLLYSLTMPMSERQLDNLLRIVETISAYTSVQREEQTGSGLGGYGSGGGSTGVWVQFGVQNTEQLVQRATRNGVAQARRMAEAAAQQAGKRIVKLVRISVANASTGQMPASAAPYLPSSPITWNPVQVSVQVTADFEAQ